jgi:pimeloyl-ACP methyl ester carboxylesterase
MTAALLDPRTTDGPLLARNGDVELWTDSHGDGSAVVLLMGAGCQAIQWEASFTDPIVAAGHRVVRFDWRDVGLSSRVVGNGAPPSPLDFVADVVAVLDRHGLDDAHLVGFSMGAGYAQLVAALHPDRVRSLTAMSGPVVGVPVPHTPTQEAAYRELCARPPEDHLAAWMLAVNRRMAGPALAFDDAEWRHRIDGWLARGHNPRCCHLRIWRHHHQQRGPFADPDVCRAVLSRITAPTLALHGEDDPMLPAAGADVLAAIVGDGTAHRLAGRGHDLWLDPTGEITGRIVEHLRGADGVPPLAGAVGSGSRRS